MLFSLSFVVCHSSHFSHLQKGFDGSNRLYMYESCIHYIPTPLIWKQELNIPVSRVILVVWAYEALCVHSDDSIYLYNH